MGRTIQRRESLLVETFRGKMTPIENGCKCGWCKLKWADHDAREPPMWKVQHIWNSKLEDRVRFLEVRIFLFAGAAALLGSGLGVWLVQVLLKKSGG